MENEIEKGPERMLNREEVLEVISRFAENATVTRELSDDQGLYLLEATVPGESEGEVIEYSYMRKGSFGKNSASETALHKVIYQDDIPVGGEKVSTYNPETDQWIDEA